MTALAASLGIGRTQAQWIAVGAGVLFVWAVIAIFDLHRSREGFTPAGFSGSLVQRAVLQTAASPMVRDFAHAKETVALQAAEIKPAAGMSERKIVRTSSMEMVVEHPDQAIEKIAALADGMGGYLVTSASGGAESTAGSLTVRVPGSRFEEARAEIRKLGARVESERVDDEDVTRQYVDQDATIRNLKAEEAGYLFILKQATTVKDMLAVSQRLSEVRGLIEQQQAEFNALSRQIETVAISISLRTEPKEQVFGLNWRPIRRLKIALRDGLESIATYAVAMTSVLFYLPAVLLWVGTIFAAGFASWRVARWVGRRWLGWKDESRHRAGQQLRT